MRKKHSEGMLGPSTLQNHRTDTPIHRGHSGPNSVGNYEDPDIPGTRTENESLDGV